MPTDTRTPKYRLLDHLIVAKTGQSLRQYVDQLRASGSAWRNITANIAQLTGEDVSITTINEWFADAEPKTGGGAA